MKHFIIDGYNALFKIKAKLKKQYQTREGFVQYVKTTRCSYHKKNKYSLIFDGAKGVSFDSKFGFSPLNVIFSKGENADEKIVKMIEREKHKGTTFVVTDDRELQERVLFLGCSTVSVLDFFGELTGKKKSSDTGKPSLDSSEGKDITDEMKKIWGIYQ